MLEYDLLASGSKGNCCLVRDEKTSLVIDCGSTGKYLRKCFAEIGYDFKGTDALFITHTHTDHISQLNMFKDIETYSSCFLDTPNFHILDSFAEVQIGDLRVKVLPTSHDSFESCGYLIESPKEKMVYITDTGYVKEKVQKYIKNADYYIFESNHDVEMLMDTNRPMYIKQRIASDIGHLCNEYSASILAHSIGPRTKEIVLAHISQEGNTYELAKQVLVGALEENNIPIDGIRIEAARQFEIVSGGVRND